MRAASRRPSRQRRSTVKPPRARSPRTYPSRQLAGSAGSSSISLAVGLQQHLGDPGGSARVAVEGVDVLRRPGHPARGVGHQVGLARVRDQVGEVRESLVALEQAGEVDGEVGLDPLRLLPARGLLPALDRDLRGTCQVRCVARSDLPFREEGAQMRGVTMAGIGLLVVVQPLLQLSVPPDPERRQQAARFGDPGPEFGIDVEQLRALGADTQHGLHEDPVGGGAHRDRALAPVGRQIPVLRGLGGAGDQPAVLRLRHQMGQEEFGGLPEDRVDALTQEGLIAVRTGSAPTAGGRSRRRPSCSGPSRCLNRVRCSPRRW